MFQVTYPHVYKYSVVFQVTYPHVYIYSVVFQVTGKTCEGETNRTSEKYHRTSRKTQEKFTSGTLKIVLIFILPSQCIQCR